MADIETLGVVGAGFMGSGIAEAAAVAGLQVIVYEPEESALERSRGRLDTSLAKAVARGASSTRRRPMPSESGPATPPPWTGSESPRRSARRSWRTPG